MSVKLADVASQMKKEKDLQLSRDLKAKIQERMSKKSLPKLAKLRPDNSLECILCKFACKDDTVFNKHMPSARHKKAAEEFSQKQSKSNSEQTVVVGEKRKNPVSYELETIEMIIPINQEEKNKDDLIEDEKKHDETQIEEEKIEFVDANNNKKEENPNEIVRKEESANSISFLPKNFFDDKEKHKIVFNTLKNSDKIELEGSERNIDANLDAKEIEKYPEIIKESPFVEETLDDEIIKGTLNKDEEGEMIDDLRKRLEIKKRNLETILKVEKPANSEIKFEESDFDLINFNWKRKKI